MGMSNVGLNDIRNLYFADQALGRFDRDGSDGLDRGEFRRMLGGMLPFNSNAMFKKADKDGSGDLDLNELAAFIGKMRGNSKKEDYKDFLKKMIEMLGGDPSGVNSIYDLENMLKDLMGDGNCDGPATPKGGGCGGSPASGGQCGTPTPSNGGGYCPPPMPPANHHDSGGGNKNELVATRGQIKSDMKTSDYDGNGKLNRGEFGDAMDLLNDRAGSKGTDSYLTEKEKNNLFNRFDRNGDGELSQYEQNRLTNYLTSGNPSNYFDNRLTVGDWNKMNRDVPNR